MMAIFHIFCLQEKKVKKSFPILQYVTFFPSDFYSFFYSRMYAFSGPLSEKTRLKEN